MTYKNPAIIYNPRAGRLLRNGGLLPHTVEALKRHGWNPALIPTTGPGTAGPLARQAIAGGAGLILVAGGDGTLNETIEGMVHSPVPVAVLPAGTANVFATETRLGRQMEAVAKRLPECRPHRVALGRLTCEGGRVTRHFLLMAGIGLDAHVVYNVNAALKARTGKFAYWTAGLSLLNKDLPEFTAEVDGEPHRCSFALVSRVRNYGGDFEIARETTLFDDRFEVVLFEGKRSRTYLKYLFGMLTGKLAGLKGVSIRRASSVKIDCPQDQRVYIQIDGEYAGHLPATIEIVPDALTILIPPEYGVKN